MNCGRKSDSRDYAREMPKKQRTTETQPLLTKLKLFPTPSVLVKQRISNERAHANREFPERKCAVPLHGMRRASR